MSVAPLLNLAKDLSHTKFAKDMYTSANNYIMKVKDSAPALYSGASPIAKPLAKTQTTSKALQKSSLSTFAVASTALLAATTLKNQEKLDDGVTQISNTKDTKKAQTDDMISKASTSPLLQNQVYLKDSLDDVIHAINSNSLTTVSVFGSLESLLGQIGSSLITLSDTLIEISDNYQSELLNLGEMPYINDTEFVEKALSVGVSPDTISDIELEFKTNGGYSSGISVNEAKQLRLDARNKYLTNEQKMALTAVSAGVSTPSYPQASENSYYKIMSDWATSSKVLADYKISNQDVKDLNGNLLSTYKPMELEAIKNATHARNKTDENNFKLSNDEIDDLLDISNGVDISSMFEFESLVSKLSEVYK